jgi:predicted DNA-binding transcriptional regulator AlpA
VLLDPGAGVVAVVSPPRLYTVSEIAKELGISRKWIHNRLSDKESKAPPAAFRVHTGGKDPMLLWTEQAVARWRAFYASTESIPSTGRFFEYSDHQAVNMVRNQVMVTWKLWWRNTYDGKAEWWFSTPVGWFTSDDDGKKWVDTQLMVRPQDYRYFCVNGNAKPTSTVAAVLRSALQLRDRIGDDDLARSN